MYDLRRVKLADKKKVGIVGYGVRRRGERDRVALIVVLWLFILISLYFTGRGFYAHLQTGAPAALTQMIVGLGWAVLAAGPLLILHRPKMRSKFTEAT